MERRSKGKGKKVNGVERLPMKKTRNKLPMLHPVKWQDSVDFWAKDEKSEASPFDDAKKN